MVAVGLLLRNVPGGVLEVGVSSCLVSPTGHVETVATHTALQDVMLITAACH